MGEYIYVGGEAKSGNNWKIPFWKIRKSDFGVEKVIYFDGAMYESILDIVEDGDFVYVSCSASSTIFKLNKSDLSIEAESEVLSGAAFALVVSGNYVFAELKWARRIVKLDKSDLSIVEESEQFYNYPSVMIDDSSYLYVGFENSCGVQKVAKSDLEFEELYNPMWSGYYEKVTGLAIIGDDLFVVDSVPTSFDKRYWISVLDKSDMSLKNQFLEYSIKPLKLWTDSSYLYCYDGNVAGIAVIDPDLEEIVEEYITPSKIIRILQTDFKHFYWFNYYNNDLQYCDFDTFDNAGSDSFVEDFVNSFCVEQFPPPDPTDPSFPDNIFEPREKENDPSATYDPLKKTVIYVEDIKRIENEIKAIQEAIGVGTIPALGTIRDRLDKLEL